MDTSYFKDRHVLVTGGAGFIGSNLVISLLSVGAKVRVLDNLSTGKISNLDECIKEIQFINGDIRDKEEVRSALRDTKLVFHQAALPSVPRSIQDPLTSFMVNAQGTLNVLLAARDSQVSRVVYASSSSIYGDSPILPKEENMPINPKSPYALSKYCGENYCQLFSQLYDLETVSLRYFNVFGPKQDPTSQYAAVVPRFITRIMQGKPIKIYGDGTQTRDFTYIDNVVAANMRAALSENIAGEIFNVACESSITINSLAEFIMASSGIRVNIEYLSSRRGEVHDSLASVVKAVELMEYQPSVSVFDGLKKTISWFSSHYQ